MHELGHVLERELPDGILEVADRFVAAELIALVHRLLVIAQLSLAKQLRLAVVGVPTGVLNPLAHKEVAPGHPVGVQRIRAIDDGPDFGGGLGRTTFVGVQAEDPFVRAGGNRLVAQIAKALELYLHHACAHGCGNVLRAVGAMGIDQNDLVGPVRTFDRGPDFFRFVEGNDVNGNQGH